MSEHERDTLISRVADGEASDADWGAFRRLAEVEPTLWRELAEMQRDAAELSAAVNRAIALADGVEAPADTQIVARLGDRLRLVAMWGGWAAAAAVALAWGTGQLDAPRPAGPLNTAGLANFATPDDALHAYLSQGKQAGQVVNELPAKYILDTRPTGGPDGRVEVIYIRQILERAVVDDLYRFGQDEQGRASPIRIEIQARHPSM